GYSNMESSLNTTNGPVFGGFFGCNMQWVPYAVVGIAVGRFNYANLDLVTRMFVGKDNAFDSGIVAGLGVD
ncbi:MAG: hypothetical protein ACM3Z4_02485, partial [Hyphomicrobiales bacterium]